MIYWLYSCDKQKSRGSGKVVCITKDRSRFYRVLAQEIQTGRMLLEGAQGAQGVKLLDERLQSGCKFSDLSITFGYILE
jgi:hypothetical protein